MPWVHTATGRLSCPEEQLEKGRVNPSGQHQSVLRLTPPLKSPKNPYWVEFNNFVLFPWGAFSLLVIVQEAVIKTILKEKNCKKAKWFSEETLQIAEKRREAKGKREKEI